MQGISFCGALPGVFVLWVTCYLFGDAVLVEIGVARMLQKSQEFAEIVPKGAR
jgi:hypothetical protein